MENKTILSVRNLTKKYDSFELDHINFDINPGIITGLIGPNGAGKSTTMKLLLKIIEPDSGTVFFEKEDILNSASMKFKSQIGYVGENLDYFIKADLKSIKKFYKSFYENWDETYYSDLLKVFDFNDGYIMNQLSKGMRVKFALCLALSHRPKVLLMDEPTSGLDPLVRNEILDILKDYAKTNNAGILFSSHITEDMSKIADDLLFIYNGKIVDRCQMNEVTSSGIDIDEHLKQLVIKHKGDSI